ncbi:MAG: alpha/beta fold hydrolase [Promethearchaeota archaeon]
MFRIPIFKYKNIEINYYSRGKGEVILLIPGMGNDHSTWTLQFSYFRRKMRVLSLDNRGSGKSSKPDYRYTMDMFTDDIYALLNHLNIEMQIHLVGHSMGGMIAQAFVLKYPEVVKTLTILAAPTYIDNSFKQVFKQLETIMQESDLETRFKKTLEFNNSESFIKNITQNKSLYDVLLDQFIKQSTTFDVKDYINQRAALSGFDTRKLLHKITQPTLIIHGTDDKIPVEHSKILNKEIPNSRLELLEGLGHAFVLEEPVKVNNLIWNFLQAHLSQ